MRKEVKKNGGKGQNEEQRKKEKGESKTEGIKVRGDDRKKTEQNTCAIKTRCKLRQVKLCVNSSLCPWFQS